MTNPSSVSQEITVGFPMPTGKETHTKVPDPLHISFDGRDAVVTPPGGGSQDGDDRRDWVWYYCQHAFKPGTTEVAVKTVLRASRVYSTPFRESLFYCIQTGGNWAKNIGQEEVTVRFPYQLQKDQITSATPADFKIDGDCVRWRFADFKPKGKEFDIAVSYVRPDVMRVIAALWEEVAKKPQSSAAAVNLAKHLLVLGNAKSNSGFPPYRLTNAEYESILAKTRTPNERQIFVQHYQINGDGLYQEISSEWTPERLDLIQILADAGYRDHASQSAFIVEGEDLLKNVLARDPHNAEAWNVYLANYWRFSFAAIGHWFGATRLSFAQAKLIESAAQDCPTDECIRLWLELCRNNSGKRDTTALMEAIKRHGFLQLQFPKIEYDYY